MRNFIREKKIHCGDKYLEVDIFPYSKSQQEASRKGKRSKKKKETAPKQKNLNDKRARRCFTQKVNANFGEGDLHLTLTYKEKYLPKTDEEAANEINNFLRKVKYHMKKKGISLKYMIVTQGIRKKGSDKPVRIHHHIIMNGGLSREEIENLWRRRRKKGEKQGEKIGIANANRLQPDGNGVAALCEYLAKHTGGKKRWSSSRNLENPWSRTNDYKYSKREVERIVRNRPDRSYWERKYQGWTVANTDFIKYEYNEVTGQWSIYLRLCRRE